MDASDKLIGMVPVVVGAKIVEKVLGDKPKQKKSKKIFDFR